MILYLSRRKIIFYIKKTYKQSHNLLQVLYERNVAKTKDIIIKTNVIFHSLLREGLAKNLTVLVLGRCCDNEILKIIGEHCRHLNKLDIVASWYVNDNGFKYLCLKVIKFI